MFLYFTLKWKKSLTGIYHSGIPFTQGLLLPLSELIHLFLNSCLCKAHLCIALIVGFTNQISSRPVRCLNASEVKARHYKG
jgi:hypothetical protein